MSGTSLDGLDLALCAIAGSGPGTAVTLERFRTAPYDAATRARLREVVFREQVSLAALCAANGWLAELHARLVRESLAAWGVTPAEVDALASHGQTVYHAPAAWREDGSEGGEPHQATARHAMPHHATLQIGDGDRLAVATGILTVSDLRQKEIAGGGQGAPLVPYVDALLYGDPARGRVLVNLGGIANFTWLPPAGGGAPAAGDTGPGNTLIDGAVRRDFPGIAEGFDREGALAARGAVHAGALAALKAHPYFGAPCPKSTGPELFGEAYVAQALAAAGVPGLGGAELVATLTRFTAETLAETLRREAPALAGAEGFVTGGGRHNRTLMGWLRDLLPELTWRESDLLGVPPDAKEALVFAVLANETLAGAGFAVPFGSTGRPPLGFGKLSFPD
ncbi:MAG: anhydro-N-acetylmuramic acid kinase [Candidatus Lambdaproteobacteria bacterium]|nr:anhydro-N-acetylmuramic acid kinase [Candidatus Lambdaproteobacteria bacterium]